MKKVYAVSPVDGCFITAGKRYEVKKEDGRLFEITADNGNIYGCLWEDCAHIGKNNWQRIEVNNDNLLDPSKAPKGAVAWSPGNKYIYPIWIDKDNKVMIDDGTDNTDNTWGFGTSRAVKISLADWNDNPCGQPIIDSAVVDVETEDGRLYSDAAMWFSWFPRVPGKNIKRWRIHQSEPLEKMRDKSDCIDGIRAQLTAEEFRGYCKGSAVELILSECGDESLQKAAWYLSEALK